MKISDIFAFIVNQIHTVIAATVDATGLPVTCAIDMMDYDDKHLYFLTAKGKEFYSRLTEQKFIAFTGIKGNNTLSSVAVSIKGKTLEIGDEMLLKLFQKNPYMYEIYPTPESRKALTVFCIYEGSCEWFDLSKKPIERTSLGFGNIAEMQNGYFITNKCNGCGNCLEVCPQNCIDTGKTFRIEQNHCLHCGNCFNVCTISAIEKRG